MPAPTAATMPARTYNIEAYTTTVCPECCMEQAPDARDPQVWKDGMLVSHDGSIWMRRFCGRHGETESLYEEHEDLWRSRQGWSTPTLTVTPDRADNWQSFPAAYRDGLPASHGQHSCILLLNLTQRCNYSCPTCYASALPPGSPAPVNERPQLKEILHTVQTMISREGGKISVLMLSGGEPTVREDLPEILQALAPLPITRILVNTNGRRIARDDFFVNCLHKLRKRVEVYLQFDGPQSATSRALRGEDVVAEKLLTLQRLETARVFTTLVCTVAAGANDEFLGDILQTALNFPHCAGLALQPVFGSGRGPGFDPLHRVTPTGVMRRLSRQSGGLLREEDFIPLPCSHRDCCDITYLLQDGKGAWRSIPQLVGREELKKWIHLIGNTISFDNLSEPLAAMLKSGGLVRLFSEQMQVGTPQLMLDMTRLCDCVPGLTEVLGGIWRHVGRQQEDAALDQAAQRTLRITIKMFMDAHTFHAARLRQCCVHTGTFESDPRRYSFCWRWLFADATDFPEDAIVLEAT